MIRGEQLVRIFLFEGEKQQSGGGRENIGLVTLALSPPPIFYPSHSPVRWLPQVRNFSFRRGKYLIPRPRGKTGYCQWLATRPLPSLIRQSLRPEEGGGRRVGPQGPPRYTLLGNLISTKKLIWCISLNSRCSWASWGERRRGRRGKKWSDFTLSSLLSV